MLLRDTLNAEYAAIDQFRIEQNVLAVDSLGFERQNNVEIRFGKRIGVYVDIDVDRRSLFARAQRQRRAGLSKERSLMYWARMLRDGWAVAPLPFFTSPAAALSLIIGMPSL